MAPAPEPAHRHGQPARTAVLLANLGTPDAPTPAALRRYLGEFLWDPRVVEIPRALWWPILHGVILRLRPAKSAAKYQSIWTDEGSPLLAHTVAQAKLLAGYLGERGHAVPVLPAMRYGKPSIAAQLNALKAQGAQRILVLPLYPQYSGATTASTFDAVGAWARQQRLVPELRLVARYHDEPDYISALATSVRAHWQQHGRGRILVMSFHGMPERTLHLGDPYHCECHATARRLAQALGLQADEYRVCFQSRFGKAKWLEPATDTTLRALPAQGHARVDVICPGFAADCLETLEEIAMEGRESFMHAGGTEYFYIPCLNRSDEGMRALLAVALRHLQGWPTQAPDAAALDAQRQRALALGATG